MNRLHLLLVGILAMLLVAVPASAATTFTSSVTSANGELATTLTWESDRQQCEASGHAEWSGPQPSSGTRVLPPITMSGTYALSLVCSSPGDTTADISWTNATQNTDGSELTDLASTRIHYGRAAGQLVESVQVDPATTQHSIPDLAPGRWYFSLRHVNSTGVESELTPVVSWVSVSPRADAPEVVTLTVNPVPRSPSGVSVE